VSKIRIFFAKQLGLDKAIPHFSSLVIPFRASLVNIKFMVQRFFRLFVGQLDSFSFLPVVEEQVFYPVMDGLVCSKKPA
jgi:hypothetical protein